MNISYIIEHKISLEHRGREKAILREKLLEYCQVFQSDLTDREMRRMVKDIPKICSCEDGYYVAISKQESDYSIEYLKKKIFPLWEDIKKIQSAYPEYYQEKQLELF